MSTVTLSTEVGTVVNEEVYQKYFRDKFNRLMKKGKPFSANDFVGGKILGAQLGWGNLVEVLGQVPHEDQGGWQGC